MALALLSILATPAQAASGKPNILAIWGDDIGVHNVSADNNGIIGYETPNIDRLAKEGVMFTHAYVQQSCTAGRASFIPGQPEKAIPHCCWCSHPLSKWRNHRAIWDRQRKLKPSQSTQQIRALVRLF